MKNLKVQFKETSNSAFHKKIDKKINGTKTLYRYWIGRCGCQICELRAHRSHTRRYPPANNRNWKEYRHTQYKQR